MSTSIGDRLYELRERSGFTAKELSRRAGVSESSIYLFERNSTVPSMRILMTLASTLGAGLEDFGDCKLPEDRRCGKRKAIPA